MDEESHNQLETGRHRSRISGSLSPIVPNLPFLKNQSQSEGHSTSHSTSLSPIHQSLQNAQAYTAQPHDPDIENIEYITQTPIENSRLLHVLSDLVKTFIDTEHDIQKSLIDLGIENKVLNKEEFLQSFVSLNEDINERLSETNDLCEDGPDLTPNSIAMYFTPPSGQNEVEMEEDVVLGASRRLRTAVDRILKLLSEMIPTNPQNDFNSIVKRNEELLSELNEECVRRNKLTAQLMQMEDRVKCLERDKTGLTENLMDYNETKRQLETMRAKLEEYESDRDKWVNDNKRLEQEKCSFAQGLPQLHKILVSNNSTAQNTLFPNTELVTDNEGLNSDVLQLQQERLKLLQKIHALTLECEQLRAEKDEIFDEKRRECEDFSAQIEAKEKNLLSYRKFIEEQTHEREGERDEYLKELIALTERLKDKEKNEFKLRSRLEEMETQITCLTEEMCFKDKQLFECNSQLKSANNEIMDLKTQLNQTERENDKNIQEITNLRAKMSALNEAFELQFRFNEDSAHEVLATNILEQITSKTYQLQNTLGSVESESEDTSIECSYNDIRLLSEKLNALNECIDRLVVQNNGLKYDLQRIKNHKNKDLEEVVKEKDSLERNLTEILRSNEILKEELNSKHIQMSALKTRLESSLDLSEMKYMIEDLQNKLISEEQKNNKLNFENISMKQQIDDKCNEIQQLIACSSQLKSANNEINDLKTRLKQIERENDRNVEEITSLTAKMSALNIELQIIFNEDSARKVLATNILEQISSKTQLLQNSLGSVERELEDKSNECSHNDIQLISEKLNTLNKCIDSLLLQNNGLKCDLQRIKNHKNKDFEEVVKVKDSLERNLSEILRSNEILKEELNSKHIQMSALKTRLESSLDLSEMKYMIEDLQNKLISEEQKNNKLNFEVISLKQQIDDKCNEMKQLIACSSQLKSANNEINDLKTRLKQLTQNFRRLQTENKERKEKLNSNSGKSLNILSEKTTESDERLNGVSNQLLWKLKRVISHKKALIHQKKYLLHVLGGFQLTERATLALLANMNVTVDDELPALQTSKNRFRSVVYCVIAISRMKLLVTKWKSRNQMKIKSNALKTVSTNSLGATNELQTDSTLQEFVNRLQRLHDTLGLRTGQI